MATSCSAVVPDAEHAEAQVQEVVALSLIYPEEFQLVSAKERQQAGSAGCDIDDDSSSYEYPIQYTIRLASEDNNNPDDGCSPCLFSYYLRVEYPARYPDEAPLLSVIVRSCLENENENHSQQDHIQTQLLEAVQAEVEIGIPCIMQCIQAGQDFLEANTSSNSSVIQTTEEKDEGVSEEIISHEETNHEDQPSLFVDFIENILPRPLLLLILEQYCTVRDRGQWSVVSRFVRTVVERRAQRALQQYREQQDNNNDWRQDNDDNIWNIRRQAGMTVDGVQLMPWEMDVRRARQEFANTYTPRAVVANNANSTI